jgi:hypothetical protein
MGRRAVSRISGRLSPRSGKRCGCGRLVQSSSVCRRRACRRQEMVSSNGAVLEKGKTRWMSPQRPSPGCRAARGVLVPGARRPKQAHRLAQALAGSSTRSRRRPGWDRRSCNRQGQHGHSGRTGRFPGPRRAPCPGFGLAPSALGRLLWPGTGFPPGRVFVREVKAMRTGSWKYSAAAVEMPSKYSRIRAEW